MQTSSSQYSKTEVLNEFVRCVDLASIMLDFTSWEGHIDLIPGEEVTRLLDRFLMSSVNL